MKKLNNKGITTVEVLICFVLVVVITVAIYATVSSFNEKKIIEGYKEEIYSFKNSLTQDIQNDFIKIGLTHARYEKTVSGDKITHTVYCNLKDGTERQLVIEQTLYHIGGSTTSDDAFRILYGTPPSDLIDREFPDLGHSGYDSVNRAICNADKTPRPANCRKIQDLSINNVYIDITDDNVLSIYIGFYHPELATRYGINIVCPIDYVSSGYDNSSKWTY